MITKVRIGSNTYSEYDLIRSITQASFFDFVKEFWHTVEDRPLLLNWHIEYLCNEAQMIVERMLRRERKKHDLVINVSPGSTKSIIFSILLQPWIWAKHPAARIITSSYEHQLSLKFTRKSRNCIKSDL